MKENRVSDAVSEDFPDVLKVDYEDNRVIVVGDLHLSGGQHPEDGKYRATENFFYDDEFANLLNYLEKNQEEKPWKLIINGDFIDFIRLTVCPEPEEYGDWENILKDVGINMKIDEFKVSDRERDLGLKTHEYKSVWKMDFIGKAHSKFFKALAQFIDKGNRLVIIKGNHDAEFYWEKVRFELKHLILKQLNLNYSDPEARRITGSIEFCNRAYILERKIYIEHGHQYEDTTRIEKSTLEQDKNDELTLPWGSLINRYFLNKAELVAPYLDNIKPVTAYLDATFKNYPLRSIKTVLKYVPLTWEMLQKKGYRLKTWNFIRKIVKYSMFPLVLIFLVSLPSIYSPFREWLSAIPFVGKYLADIKVGGVISAIFAVLPFILPTLTRKDLVTPAISKITTQYPGLTHVILGHFHSPDQRKYKSCSYFNSGTWIPMINLREKLKDKVQFCLILIEKNQNGDFKDPVLWQWNNCSGRLEKIILTETAAPEARKRTQETYDNI